MVHRSSPDKVLLSIILLIVFLLPLNNGIIPPLIIVWVLVWLFLGNFKEKINNLKKSGIFFLLAVFYLLHVLGMIYTSNFPEGLFDLEVKFSLLLFPVLIFSHKEFFEKNKNSILSVFLFGNITAALICFGYGFYRTLKYDINYFTYRDFSLFHHTSYASMYALFSIGIILFFLLNKKKILDKLIAIFLLVILCAFIFILGSRAGIIAAIIVPGFITMYYLWINKKWFFLLTCLIIFIALPFFILHNHPRFIPVVEFINTPRDSIKMTSPENIMVRYNIALQSMELIKQNFFSGTGTGDVKDALMELYRQKNITFALDTKLNSHNQFLETFIGLGIPGILSLALLIFYPLYSGFKTNTDYQSGLLIAFSLIIITNFMFESMLNTQAGTVFFAFFYCLLCSVRAAGSVYKRSAS